MPRMSPTPRTSPITGPAQFRQLLVEHASRRAGQGFGFRRKCSRMGRHRHRAADRVSKKRARVQRLSALSGQASMISRRAHACREREARRKRLAEEIHIRRDVEMLAGKESPRAVEARVDFVEHEEHLCASQISRSRRRKSFGGTTSPPRPWTGFDKDRANLALAQHGSMRSRISARHADEQFGKCRPARRNPSWQPNGQRWHEGIRNLHAKAPELRAETVREKKRNAARLERAVAEPMIATGEGYHPRLAAVEQRSL